MFDQTRRRTCNITNTFNGRSFPHVSCFRWDVQTSKSIGKIRQNGSCQKLRDRFPNFGFLFQIKGLLRCPKLPLANETNGITEEFCFFNGHFCRRKDQRKLSSSAVAVIVEIRRSSSIAHNEAETDFSSSSCDWWMNGFAKSGFASYA